jgi:hypothetical protein
MLYPAISLGSRESHKVEVNLGVKKFKFNIDIFVQNKYYYEIFNNINNFECYKN